MCSNSLKSLFAVFPFQFGLSCCILQSFALQVNWIRCSSTPGHKSHGLGHIGRYINKMMFAGGVPMYSKFTILNSKFTILNSQSGSQFTIHSSQFSIRVAFHNSQFTILNLQFSIYNSQFTILNSQFSIYLVTIHNSSTLGHNSQSGSQHKIHLEVGDLNQI